ncbi:transcriptional regulator, partial [Streptomyces sp. NPDC059851]|uniref:transcriptional regulator n=1 Tax=Streptomyces sp. NPDC059851 TaxID=3346971 RepID=UPI003658BD25
DVAAVLGSLVDKSLVIAAPTPDGMRYRLLETIHEYAAERAAERDAGPGTTAGAARRHAAHYLALAERAEPILRTAAQLPWIRRLETELDNFRAALDHTIGAGATDPAAAETAQRLALALGWFWWLRDYRREAAQWTARVLALGPTEPDPTGGSPAYWRLMRLQLLHTALFAYGRSSDEYTAPITTRAGRLHEVFRRGGPEAVPFPGVLWPIVAFLAGGMAGLGAAIEEGIANCRRHGGDWELAAVLLFRTHNAVDTTGGLPTVDADLAEIEEIARRVGDRWMRSQVASVAGEIAFSRGLYERAGSEYEECLRLAREVGAHPEAPFALARIAESAFCQGDMDRAERLLAEAHRETEQYGGGPEIRAYGGMLSALIALVRRDPAAARTHCDQARAAAAKTSAPSQLITGIDHVDAVLTGYEQGAEVGLAKIGPTLAAAVTAHCAERVLASVTESAAVLLEAAGRPAASVRALAAATAWRAGHPRSVPEEGAVSGLPDRTRASLGPERQLREEAVGTALSPSEVVALLSGS